jgi:hypothetical protein
MPALLAQNVDFCYLTYSYGAPTSQNPKLLIKDPPFYIPEFELKWHGASIASSSCTSLVRQLILFVARQMIEEENREFLTIIRNFRIIKINFC